MCKINSHLHYLGQRNTHLNSRYSIHKDILQANPWCFYTQWIITCLSPSGEFYNLRGIHSKCFSKSSKGWNIFPPYTFSCLNTDTRFFLPPKSESTIYFYLSWNSPLWSACIKLVFYSIIFKVLTEIISCLLKEQEWQIEINNSTPVR